MSTFVGDVGDDLLLRSTHAFHNITEIMKHGILMVHSISKFHFSFLVLMSYILFPMACVLCQVNHLSRTVVSTGYLSSMYRAKVIVTANPSNWEGGESIYIMVYPVIDREWR